MLGEFQAVENRLDIVFHNLLRRLSAIQDQHDRDQSLDQLRIAVGAELEVLRTILVLFHHQPDVADTALDTIFFATVHFIQWRQAVTQFDHVAVTIIPFVEQLKVVDQILR